MTATESLVAPSAAAPPPPGERPSYLQQVLDSTWVTITLAILMALVASSVLIAAANAEVQAAAGYFFSRPSDLLGAARVEVVPAGFWARRDRHRLERTGGTLEQYKRPALINDLDFPGPAKQACVGC